MKKLIIPLGILIFVLIQNVSANEIYSEINELDLCAGCSTTFNITIPNEGDTIKCYIETEILPDDEGIYVSYEKGEVFDLEKGTNTIGVTVNTSMLLAPSSYVIKVSFLKEEPEKKGDGGKKKRTGSNPPIIRSEPTYDAPYDPPELFPPEEPREPRHYEYIIKKDGFPWIWLLPIPIVIILFTLLLLFRNRRKTKK